MFEWQDDLDRVFKHTSLIGYGTSMSVIFYGLIGFFVLKYSSRPEPFISPDSFVKSICVGIALGFAGLAWFIRAKIRQDLEVGMMSVDAALRRLQTSTLVTYGLCEGIGLVGLIVAYLTQSIQDYYPYAFAALLAFSLFFPRYNDWERVIQRQQSRAIT